MWFGCRAGAFWEGGAWGRVDIDLSGVVADRDGSRQLELTTGGLCWAWRDRAGGAGEGGVLLESVGVGKIGCGRLAG